MYGFKCLVIGYDWITNGNGLKNLETELSFLGGACAASLMKKNLALPPATSMYYYRERNIYETYHPMASSTVQPEVPISRKINCHAL